MKKPSESQVGGDHYKSMPIQPHYFCHVNKLGALESNVVKYICRHATKGGRADLLKAKHYVELLLEWQYGDDGQTTIVAQAERDAETDRSKLRIAIQNSKDLPFGWPYAQSGAVDADEVGELTEPDGAALSMIECCKHGLTICKVCEFGYPESI